MKMSTLCQAGFWWFRGKTLVAGHVPDDYLTSGFDFPLIYPTPLPLPGPFPLPIPLAARRGFLPTPRAVPCLSDPIKLVVGVVLAVPLVPVPVPFPLIYPLPAPGPLPLPTPLPPSPPRTLR